MDVDGVCALFAGVCQEALPRLFVAGAVGVLAYGHPEDLAELGPVSHVAALVEGVRGAGGQLAESARVVADQQAVVEELERGSVHVGLVQQHLPGHRVEVLPVDELVGDPALLVAPELEEGEAPHLRGHGVLHPAAEPGRADLPVHLVHGLPVPLELEALAADGAQALLHDAAEVAVRLEDGVIDVVQLGAVVEVDGLRRLERGHVPPDVEVEELRRLQDDRGVLLARKDLGRSGLRDLLAFLCHGVGGLEVGRPQHFGLDLPGRIRVQILLG